MVTVQELPIIAVLYSVCDLIENAAMSIGYTTLLLLHHFPILIFQRRKTPDDHRGQRKKRTHR